MSHGHNKVHQWVVDRQMLYCAQYFGALMDNVYSALKYLCTVFCVQCFHSKYFLLLESACPFVRWLVTKFAKYRPERPMGAKDEVKRPEGPPAKSRSPEGP